MSFDTRYCDTHRNVDKLIDNYEHTRNEILRNIPLSLESLWSKYLSTDRYCSADNKCSQCKCLSRLCSLKINEPFLIECGSMVGTPVVLINHQMKNIYAQEFILAAETRRLISVEKRLTDCGTPEIVPEFVSLDPISCEIILTWIVDNILARPTTILTAFQCESGATLLKVQREKLVDKDISEQDVPGLVSQIILNLSILSNNYFVHGSMSPDMIDLSDEVHNGCGVTALLNVGQSSSLTVSNTRICCKSAGLRHNLVPEMGERWKLGRVLMYRVDPLNENLFNSRRSGIPIYAGSLDLYCILVGLYCNRRFEKYISSIWGDLWIGYGDREQLEKNITSWRRHKKEYPTHNEILHIISGLWLRCDAICQMTRG